MYKGRRLKIPTRNKGTAKMFNLLYVKINTVHIGTATDDLISPGNLR